MEKLLLSSLLGLSLCTSLFAQKDQPEVTLINNLNENEYYYKVDLTKVVDDKVEVTLITPHVKPGQIRFSFPKMIPGTYAVEDYGKYISDFAAFDASGNRLEIENDGKNTYVVFQSERLHHITYKVDDTFDSNVKKDKVFEPAGTSIEEGKCFLINASGFFGYIEGMELKPYHVEFTKPQQLYGATVMDSEKSTATMQTFHAQDYHQLVDKPILFAEADTVSFMVKNTRVTLAVYNQAGEKLAGKIYDEMKACMVAIDKYLPALPVSNYSFLFYIVDHKKIGEILKKPNIGIKDIIKLLKALGGKGFGALEHGNSSVYYLPEFGIESYSVPKQVKDVAIHEFMHIVTPLSLHSQHIGNFNYTNPIMSKHLWLYEGTTEYDAGLIQYRGGLLTTNDYLSKIVMAKIRGGENFPYSKMSFTEMSENVIKKKKYKEEYTQVYERGAALGLLLDLEIIRLTDGKKNLRDVKQALSKRYGADKSFEEATFINEFIKEVHPDLRFFFNSYIEGKERIDYAKYLAIVGLEYLHDVKYRRPRNPLTENDVKTPKSVISKPASKVEKVGKKEWAGLQEGDELEEGFYKKTFMDINGEYVAEGSTVQLKVKRNGQEIMLPVKVQYIETTYQYTVKEMKKKTPEQERFFKIWSGQ